MKRRLLSRSTLISPRSSFPRFPAVNFHSHLSKGESEAWSAALSATSKNEDLRIERVTVYKADLPLHEGSYKWSAGKYVDVFDATIVQIETNQAVTGAGEQTPLGPFYLPAYAEGARSGIKAIAPHLLGLNPLNLSLINRTMDKVLKGHPYCKVPLKLLTHKLQCLFRNPLKLFLLLLNKSALDMACWDILGKVTGLPVCDLLGGRVGPLDEGFPLYRAISQDSPENMAANVRKYVVEDKYRKFQLKVGGDFKDDIKRIVAVREELDRQGELNGLGAMPLMCDANTGWLRHEAMQVVNAVKHLDVFIEQPCLSYEECLSVRKHCPLPFILDESMDDIGMLVRILADRSADAVNLKISKVGGLSKARVIRDLAVSCGIPMNIEDTWGGDIVTACIAHLAHSTPSDLLLCSTDFNSYGPAEIAKTTAHRVDGKLGERFCLSS